MQTKKRGCLSNAIALVVLAALLYVSREWIFTRLGRALVDAEAPVKADAIVVLAGDGTISRLLRAEELAREGYAPVILVSGPTGSFDIPECQLSIAFAAKRGYSTAAMKCVPNESRSTVEEALALREDLRHIGASRVLVVTSDYHTRRSARVWRKTAPDLKVHLVAAKDKYFSPDGWWKNREGQKVFVLEWTKTFAYLLGF